MSDVWELAAYIEGNPDDHQQRWRLAKKLYAEHEYLLALENLQVLNKEWTPKMNVQRYLAATYYRLGRYTEAEEHLLKTIQQWPDEVGPCEQLAHVYQVDGRTKDALDTWRRVVRISPEHTVAKRAVKTLESEIEKKESGKQSRISGIFQPELSPEQEEELLVTGVICPRCGAQNSDEFETCWQCNAVLRKQSPSFLNAPPLEAHGKYLLRPETMTTLALIVIGILLAASLALGYGLVKTYLNAVETPLLTTGDAWDRILVPGRLAAGVIMFLFWPFAIMLSLKLFRVKYVPPAILVYISGFLLGALVLVSLLLPLPFPFLAFAGSLLLSLLIVVFTFKTDVRLAPAVWVMQFIMVWVLGAVSFWVVECRRHGEWINPLVELPAVRSAVSGSRALPDSVPARLPALVTPVRQKIKWHSSGSTWLDIQASKTVFTIRPESDAPVLRFQIYHDGDLKYHEELQGNQPSSIYYPVIPGLIYEVVIQSEEPVAMNATIQSLLPHEFQE